MVEGEATWIPNAITAVSTLLAGFLGAGAALLGSRRATDQALKIAREQRRYERIHEMRAEILPKMLYDLRLLSHQLSKETSRDIRDVVQGESKVGAIADHAASIVDYVRLHNVWVPEQVGDASQDFLDGLLEQINDHISPALGNWSKDDKEASQEVLRNAYGNVNGWLHTEGALRLAKVGQLCRRALVEED